MKFALLIRSNADSEAGAMPSQDGHANLIKFASDLAAAGALVDAVGLHAAKDTTRVTLSVSPGNDKQVTVTQGPFPVTEILGGWWILDVRDEQEAIDWAKRCPLPVVGDNQAVEIRRVVDTDEFSSETLTDDQKAEIARIRGGLQKRE
jgi:hypothetical protein